MRKSIAELNKTDWSVIIALVVIPLIYFYPVLLGQVFLAPGDGWAQNFGVRALAGQMIARGELPLWNPYIFGGMPLAASVYPGSFYPPNWLFAILSPKWAMNIVVLTTYHIALIGTYLYARKIGITRLGGLIAGAAFTFGGFMINHLSHTSRIAAAAWLPWVLLAIENIADAEDQRTRWRWVVLGAFFIALQFFAGEPQMLLFTALVAAPCAIFAFFKCPDRWQFVLSIAVMLLCGALLSAIQLLPSLELLAQSERSDPGPAFFDTYSLPPWQLPGLIFPYFFGGAFFPPYRIAYWGEEIAAMMSGYVGMLTWVLAIAALFAGKRNGRVWLWFGIAVVSILLAFGGHLPFGLNHQLYQIPGYKTFRGLYRHQFEFTFAMAMLAGLGISSLSRRVLARATLAMTAIVALTIILYRFFGERLATVTPRPVDAASLANAEILVPLAFFLLSLTVLWISTGSGSDLASAETSHSESAGRYRSLYCFALVSILLLDLASYGHFFHWPSAKYDVSRRLADPPAVQLIKSRETDLNAFRVMSYPAQAYDYASAWPEDENFELINQPNISILRGLQSVGGYDLLRPVRVGEVAGSAGSVSNGFVQEINSFGLADRGLNLLNVKYLIVGHGGPTGPKAKPPGVTYDGVYFARTNFGLEFKPGVKLTTEPGGAPATEIAVVSMAATSTHLPDGAPILKFRLQTKDGRVIERDLQAGRDTSEWAYDRADVRANIKHQRARIVENTQADGFQSHFYLARLKFERAEIEKIEWIYAREDASLYLVRASLHDETTGVSTPLENFYLPPERWRRLARFDQVEVYENLQALPRAWFVDQTTVKSSDAARTAIKSGAIAEGVKFDPLKTALIEKGEAREGLGQGEVKIVGYRADRIELETNNAQAGFLVLSEVYYDGWRAYIDGREHPIYLTNYTFRGVDVPAGQHRVEFVYRPRSFRNGATLAGVGLGILLIGTLIFRTKREYGTHGNNGTHGKKN